jgi:hypothetical protein
MSLSKQEKLIKAWEAGKIIQSKSSGKWKDFERQNQVDSPNWEYGGVENWRVKNGCKDCSVSLEDCDCLEKTVEFEEKRQIKKLEWKKHKLSPPRDSYYVSSINSMPYFQIIDIHCYADDGIECYYLYNHLDKSGFGKLENRKMYDSLETAQETAQSIFNLHVENFLV